MRQLGLDWRGEIDLDYFAGGGGASTGMAMAGREPHVAINHYGPALAMHEANHPHTRHVRDNVWNVDPIAITRGRPVGFGWFSPDCTWFSKARGAKPFRDPRAAKRRRGLAWIVPRVAATPAAPRVIHVENVEEFQDWGPLLPDGTPDPKREGFTFKRWCARMRNLGYAIEWNELRACDFGAPTTRKRLFITARRDGRPIVWPRATHGPGLAPYRTAAEIIDWSIPCPSIFLSCEEGRACGAKRPLVEKTLARIAAGFQRFVFGREQPFVVRDPMRVPVLIQKGYGERVGQAPRALDLHAPLGTVVAGGVKHAIAVAFVAKHFGGNGSPGTSLHRPLSTVTTRDHHALVAASSVGHRHDEVRAFFRRFGIERATVKIDGVEYPIADIGMRALRPRELFRANGFPDDYVIDPIIDGEPLSPTEQVHLAGNSVSPLVAAALVRANDTVQVQHVAA